MAPYETSYMTTYMRIMVTNPLYMCYHGVKKQIWPPVAIFYIEQKINGHTCWPPKLSLCTKFERNPVGVIRVTAPSVFTSKMAASPPF